ncbi:MAG: hypothetical protein ABI596_15230 [Pyrinomonadaceae bacterium]
MPHDEESIPALNDLPLPVEKRFTSAQLVRCPSCTRANPPTRMNCMYCGVVLPVTEAAATLRKPTLRPLEDWEQGYNIILVKGGADRASRESLGEMASLLRLDPENLRLIFMRGGMAPLARAESMEEAVMIEERLRSFRLETVVVADAALAVDSMPCKRIRSLELLEEGVVGREPGAESRLPTRWDEILLIVAGRLFVKRVEVDDLKALSAKPDAAQARELTGDEAVLDVYTRKQDGGWRILSAGFDFSCLRERKGLLASGNFRLLTELLRQRAPQADFDDSYLHLRQALTVVWPMVQRSEGGGFRRAHMGKYTAGGQTVSDNETQFTRYSRLLHNFKLRGL